MSKHRDEIILFCTIQFIHIVFVSLDFATNNMCVHLFLKPILPFTLKPQKVYSSLLMVNLSIEMYRKSIGEIRRSSLEERLDSSMTNDSLTTELEMAPSSRAQIGSFPQSSIWLTPKPTRQFCHRSNQENQLDDTQSDRFDQQSILPPEKKKLVCRSFAKTKA